MMKLVLVVLVMTSVPSTIVGQQLAVYFDVEGTVCNRDIQQGDQGSFWVIARLDSPGATVVGAEFRITGFPSDWIGIDVMSGLAIGSAIRGDGLTVGYEAALTGELIVLWEVLYIARSDVPRTSLRVEAKVSPSLSISPALVVLGTDTGCVQTGAYEAIAVTELGEAVINGTCTTQVERRTWNHVKGLYRE